MAGKTNRIWGLFKTTDRIEKTSNTVFWFSLGGYIGLHTTALDDNFWAAVATVALFAAVGCRVIPAWWMEVKRHYAASHDPPYEGQVPQPMVLDCPRCGEPHIDEGVWAKRPHTTHLCEFCENLFKPCDYPTVGVSDEQPEGNIQ